MNKEELIANYFTKKLSHEAQVEFDQLMINDAEFAKEVTFQKNLKAVIKEEERAYVKTQLQGFETEENLTFNYKKWLVAASILVLLGVSSLWYFDSSVNTEKLYAENFEPYRNIVQPIVRGDTKIDLKTKAFTAYETKNYTEALQYFDELLIENPNETVAFYKANVLLKLDKTEDAITVFKSNLKTPDSLDAKNNWYLALAYLKLEDIENVKKHLNAVVSNPSGNYKEKEAKSILKKLE